MAEFRALLGARTTQSLGASALATVIAFQTYEVTGDPLALGLLGLVEAIPALGLMLIGGHLADRRDRRSIVIVASSALTLAALALAVGSLTPSLIGLPLILAVVFVIGVSSGFERPALSALRGPGHPDRARVDWNLVDWLELDPGRHSRTGAGRHRGRGHRATGDLFRDRPAPGGFHGLCRADQGGSRFRSPMRANPWLKA